uniref:Transcription factor n=2 Tax=Caenorhabditis japonica TaxID=281687 RepID=A0A8R1HW24_CAEJA
MFKMQPTKYDQRIVQAAQNRQQNSLNGMRRFTSAGPSRSSVLPPSSLYGDDNSYNEGMAGDRYWDEPGGAQATIEKPTGLRHFSTKVCEKVKEKGLTNYNEVADELVSDYFQNNLMKQIDVVKQEYDMKNIRRRVYDALNVLLAMNIITKNKKDIRWIGLPASASQEISRLEEEKARREASIKNKMESLQEMIMQIVAYKNLVQKNRNTEHDKGRPDPDSVLHLPFLIINTDKEANVECSVSSDKSEFLFSFDKRFEIHDDFEVLKKMKLTCGLETGIMTDSDILKAKSFLPELHKHYVDEIIDGHRRAEEEKREKEERKKQQMIAIQQMNNSNQVYYDQPMPSPASRYNRQLQEHLINDASEDQSAAAGIAEKDDDLEVKMQYTFSPQKVIRQIPSGAPPLQPPAARRFYVQKTPQGTLKREISPAIRPMSRPYVPLSGDRRMAAAGGTVGAPIKYYVSQNHSLMQQNQQSKYKVRPTPPPHGGQSQPPQRVVYSSVGQLGPGQRVISQRVVAPGGPHPPGTIIRKVIRKVVVNNGAAQKQSPAQQVIQKRMQEQHEMIERKPDQPMTSAQAAALIQHPPPEEYDYY